MARRFYDDTSAGKCLSKMDGYFDRPHAKPAVDLYEVRHYVDDKYEILESCHSKEDARVAKSFYELEYGWFGIAIVAIKLSRPAYMLRKCNLSSIYGMTCEGGD